MVLEKLDFHMWDKRLHQCLLPCTMINLELIKGLITRSEHLRLLEENTKTFQDTQGQARASWAYCDGTGDNLKNWQKGPQETKKHLDSRKQSPEWRGSLQNRGKTSLLPTHQLGINSQDVQRTTGIKHPKHKCPSHKISLMSYRNRSQEPGCEWPVKYLEGVRHP